MLINLDPTGPIPEPDVSGRLIIAPPPMPILHRNVLVLSFLAVCLLSLYHLGNISLNYIKAGMPSILNNITKLDAFAFWGSVYAIVISPFAILRTIYPTQFIIDNNGVSLIRLGHTRSMTWEQIHTIILKPIAKRNGIIRMVIIKGSQGTFKFFPKSGVAPMVLAEYVATRAKTACTWSNVSIYDLLIR